MKSKKQSKAYSRSVTMTGAQAGAWIFCVSLSASAHAQRGISYPFQPQPDSPSSGIAGFFDTNTSHPGTIVFDFPTMGLDYGLSEKITIGTNALGLLATSALVLSNKNLDSYTASGKIRFRVFSVDNWSSVLTGYILGIKTRLNSELRSDTPKSVAWLTAGTVNTSKTFRSNVIGFSLGLFDFSATNDDLNSKSYLHTKHMFTNLALWWKYNLMQNLESEVILSVCPAGSSKNLNQMMRIDLKNSCFELETNQIYHRTSLNWRSSTHWHWSLGTIGVGADKDAIFPWMGFQYVTPLFADET